MDGTREDTSLPYDKVAVWGMAASAVLTAGFLVLAPVSPVCVAGELLDEARGLLRGHPVVFAPGPGGVGTLSVDVGHREDGLAVAETVRRALHRSGRDDRALREELRRELRSELRGRGAAALQRELLRAWSLDLPDLTRVLGRELSLELRGSLTPG